MAKPATRNKLNFIGIHVHHVDIVSTSRIEISFQLGLWKSLKSIDRLNQTEDLKIHLLRSCALSSFRQK